MRLSLMIAMVTLLIVTTILFVAPAAAAYPKAEGDEYIYVAAGGSGVSYTNDILVFNPLSMQRVDTIHVSSNGNLARVTVVPAGTYIIAACYAEQYIAIYNTFDNTLVKTVPLAAGSVCNVVCSPDGSYAYVLTTHWTRMTVVTVDMKTLTVANTVDSTLDYAGEKVGVAITDDGAYVVSHNSTTIMRYTTAGGSLAYLYVKNTNATVSLDDATSVLTHAAVAFASHTDKRIYVYAVATNTMARNLVVPSAVSKITYDPINDYYYTCDYSAGNVSKHQGWWYATFQWNYTAAASDSYVDMFGSGAGVVLSNNLAQTEVFIWANGTLRGTVGGFGIYPQDAFVATIQRYTSDMRYVTFTTKTAYDTITLSGINVTIYDSVNRMMYSSVTDSAGSVVYMMNTKNLYKLLFNQTPNVNNWYNVTPGDITGFIVRIDFSQIIGLTSWTDVVLPDTASAVSHYTIDHPFDVGTGAGYMNSTFSDDSGKTSSVGFLLFKNGSLLGDSMVYVSGQLDASPPYAANFSIPAAAGNNYQIVIRANQTGGGYYNYSTGLAWQFPGPKWLNGILPLNWYFWIAFGLMMIMFSVGTVAKKGLFGIFGAVVGAIFIPAGWFSLYLPDYVALPLVGLVFILSVILYITEREKYT